MNLSGTEKLREYLDYWDIGVPIFQSVLDNDDLFLPDAWINDLQRLLLFSGQRGSLMTFTSPSGHCKSTVARWIYQRLGVDSHEVLLLSLFQDEANEGWLLPKVAKYFGIEQGTPGALLQGVTERITETNKLGKVFTIIIDEAHKLRSPAALTELHSLISLQNLVPFGVNSVLLGDPFMMEVLDQTPELKNRVHVGIHFPSLTSKETARYIAKRLSQNNINPRMIAEGCVEEVHRLSGGVFSKLNAVLENCMIEAFLSKKKTIDFETVTKAASFSLVEPAHQKARTNSPGTPKTDRSGLPSQKRGVSKHESNSKKSVELSSLFYKSDDK
ncbi:MAG: hypothetical protein HRU19_04350 [Pseudobacteriovorax sp.]|nr:hypothetical protein [Pseudobacteriovorax sp.]